MRRVIKHDDGLRIGMFWENFRVKHGGKRSFFQAIRQPFKVRLACSLALEDFSLLWTILEQAAYWEMKIVSLTLDRHWLAVWSELRSWLSV